MLDIPSKYTANLCMRLLPSFAAFLSSSTKLGNLSSPVGIPDSAEKIFHLGTAALCHLSVLVNLLVPSLGTKMNAKTKEVEDATAMRAMTERTVGMFQLLLLKVGTNS